MDYIATKGTADRYTIKWQGGWAVVFLTEDGFFSAISDYGNYSYHWGSPGRPFKEFVIGLLDDPRYFMCKVSKMGFDYDTSLNNIKRDVLKARRVGDIDSEDARICMDEIEDNLSHRAELSEFCHGIEDCFWLLTGIYGNDLSSIPLAYEYDAQVKGFVREVFPRLAEILKKELSNA